MIFQRDKQILAGVEATPPAAAFPSEERDRRCRQALVGGGSDTRIPTDAAAVDQRNGRAGQARPAAWRLLAEAKLAERTVPEPNSGCLLFLGGVSGAGYGMFRIDGEHLLAHRVAYELNVGPIPQGFVLDHLCRVRLCANWRHLEVVTIAVNNLRGVSPAAQNVRKEDCKRGHPLAGSNLLVAANGSRHCRACMAVASRAHYERNKAAIIARKRARRAVTHG